MKKFICTYILLFTLGAATYAQETIREGKTYQAGTKLAAPKSGVDFIMPENWSGYVLLGADLLTIYLDSISGTQAMYFARQADIKQIARNWMSGLELAPGIRMEIDEKPKYRDGVLYATVHLTSQTQSKGFLFAKCGEFHNCVTVLASTPKKNFSDLEGKLAPLINNISFVQPYYPDPKEFVDWKKLLTGKYIFNVEESGKSLKESKVWLYYSGGFKSKVKRTGIYKDQAKDYQGNQKGTYWIDNDEEGKGAYLTLYFKKLPEFKLKLERDDQHYYINGQRFYYQKID